MENAFGKKYWKYSFSALLLLYFLSFNCFAQRADRSPIIIETIHYHSDSVKLKAYICKPNGNGPFPVYVWNHDGEKDPDIDNGLTITMVSFWVKKGYIFFMPIRSGHSDNPGPFIGDETRQIQRKKETEQVQFKQIYTLYEKANEDVIAGIEWIKKQLYADPSDIVVAGEGYGGIQALLTAEKNVPGVKSCIAFSPTFEIWNTMLGDSLTQVINRAKKPIFILQPKFGNILEPCETLGPVLVKKGLPNHCKIFQTEETSWAFYDDYQTWQMDVLKYLKDCGVKGKK